jgi:hypothetical protein
VLHHPVRKKRIVIYQIEGFEASRTRDVALGLCFAADVSCVMTSDMAVCDNRLSPALDGGWTRVPNFGTAYNELIGLFCDDDGDYGATVGMPQPMISRTDVDERRYWKIRFADVLLE